jgi:branched-chain amino acid transport system ATP-binding protein
MTNALEVNGLRVQYGPVTAVDGVSFEAPEGSLVALLGANGAGKTSTIRAVSGLEPVRAGEVRLFGADLARMPAHQRVAAGLVQVPERRRVFATLSVRENLELGAYRQYRKGRDQVASDLSRVLALFPRLEERLGQVAGMLSGGEQQMLAVGRALMSRPRVLMLDEPSLGLAPQVIRSIYRTLDQIREAGTTVLLVEQNARLALRAADYIYVLRAGRVVLKGPAGEVGGEDALARAYLGADGA